MAKSIPLNIVTLPEYRNHLETSEPGAWADNDDDRLVQVVNEAGGRYELYYRGESLTLTNDVYAALWFLKTGEWIGRDGRFYVDTRKGVGT